MPYTNTPTDSGFNYKGRFLIYDNSTPYEYDGIVELSEKINAVYNILYSSRGKKRVVPLGNDSQFTITVQDTATLYDTANPPTDKKSISYFVHKILSNVELPAVEFEGYNTTEATENSILRHRFKGVVVGTEKIRNGSTGIYERTLVIEITEHIKPGQRVSV